MKIHHTNRFLLATISLVLSSPAAMAADIRYVGNGDWSADPTTKWAGGVKPGNGDSARGNWGNNTVTVTTPESVGGIQWGVDEPSTLRIQTDGNLTTTGSNWSGLGAGAATTGTLIVEGGQLTIGGDFHMGYDGNAHTASLSITSGQMDVNGVFRQNRGSVASMSTTISGTGVLEVNQFLLSGANNSLNFDGGTLKAGADSTNWLTGNGAVRIKSTGATIDTAAFAVTASTALTQDGASPGGGLTKTGSGTLTLTGNHTYTGATLISEGTLQLSGSSRLNSGNYAEAITLSNSANFEKLSNEAQFLSGAITGTGTVKMDNIDGELLLQNAANDFTALNINAGRVFIQSDPGALPAAATVGLTGGTLDFDVAGTYDSAITVSSGANIAARATTSLSDVTLPGTGTVIFNNDDASTATLDISSDQTLTDTLTVQLGGPRMGETGGALGVATLSGKLSGSGSLVMTSMGNILNPNFGTGVLALSGANDYTGDTTVNSGTLAVNGTALPDGTKLTIDGGKVDLTGAETVNTLFFGAAQQPDGVYSASSVPGGATITTASFSGSGTLNVGPVSAYAAWQTANSTAQTVDLDHDNDGVSNGVEHFLGGIGNTTGNSNPLPGVTNNAGTLSVTWVRHPDFPGFPGNYGTSVVVETSATLTNPWTPAVTGVGAGFVEITENNVKYTFPAGTKNFARLKVTGP